MACKGGVCSVRREMPAITRAGAIVDPAVARVAARRLGKVARDAILSAIPSGAGAELGAMLDQARAELLAASPSPLAQRAACGPNGCVIVELAALNDATGAQRAMTQLPGGTPIEVLGTANGTIALGGQRVGPRVWTHVRVTSADGSVVEGWMAPENVAAVASPAMPMPIAVPRPATGQALLTPRFSDRAELLRQAQLLRIMEAYQAAQAAGAAFDPRPWSLARYGGV